VLVACKKEPPPPDASTVVMPPLTHQGLNTFGCYLDDELFVAGGGKNYWAIPPVSGSYDETDNRLGIQGTRYRDEISDNLTLISYGVVGVGEYDFGPFTWDKVSAYFNNKGDRCHYYYTDIPDLGKLTITHFDKTKRIIAGTFYINLINKDCEEDTLLKITDGRFDFKY
jgi:hypothetical protein